MSEIIIVIAILLTISLLYMGTRKPKRFPPGPRRLPVVGSLPYMAIKSNSFEPRSLMTGARKGFVTPKWNVVNINFIYKHWLFDANLSLKQETLTYLLNCSF